MKLSASLFTGADGYKNYLGRTTTGQSPAPIFDSSDPSNHKLVFSDFLFFFNDTATTEIYTLSLHDALPISAPRRPSSTATMRFSTKSWRSRDRKSTRLNSSHGYISYAVFCLKKKKKKQ